MNTVPAKLLFLAAWILASALGDASAQTIQVSPNPAMVDDAVAIRVTGLQPGERVTVQAELIDGAGKHWTSEAQFIANAQGGIDSSTQAPVDSSYKIISGPGLIWSMRPVDKAVRAYAPPPELATQTIDFRLMRNGRQVSSVTLKQLQLGPGVRQIQLQGELHGILFLPAGSGPWPGVLVVGGSNGGVPVEKAAWLSAHGYVAFALAYFRYENLPKDLEAIPLEYFGRALSWMMTRPEIEPSHIAVLGTSRGGELALQLGSMYTDIKAVVAYVPANVRIGACCGGTALPYAWTWRGHALAYVRGIPRSPSPSVDSASLLSAEIPVENTHGPILMIAGEDDGVWPSSMMVTEAAGRLRNAHFGYDVEELKYSHAGHSAGQPAIVPAWHGTIGLPGTGRGATAGGIPQGDAASSLDAIPKVLAFLRKSLQPDAPTAAAASR